MKARLGSELMRVRRWNRWPFALSVAGQSPSAWPTEASVPVPNSLPIVIARSLGFGDTSEGGSFPGRRRRGSQRQVLEGTCHFPFPQSPCSPVPLMGVNRINSILLVVGEVPLFKNVLDMLALRGAVSLVGFPATKHHT